MIQESNADAILLIDECSKMEANKKKKVKSEFNLFLLRMLSAWGDLMYSSTITFQRWRHSQPRKKPCTLRIFLRSSRSISLSWVALQPGLSHSFFNMHNCNHNEVLPLIFHAKYPESHKSLSLFQSEWIQSEKKPRKLKNPGWYFTIYGLNPSFIIIN